MRANIWTVVGRAVGEVTRENLQLGRRLERALEKERLLRAEREKDKGRIKVLEASLTGVTRLDAHGFGYPPYRGYPFSNCNIDKWGFEYL